MPPDPRRPVYLLATAGRGEGRGHLARALTLGETLRGLGAEVSLGLLRGDLDGSAAERATLAGVRSSQPPPDAIVVVDLPDATDASAHAPPERLVVFDDRDAFTERAAIVVQPSMPTWSGHGRADVVLAGYDVAPVAAAWTGLRRESLGESARDAVGASGRLLVAFGGSDPARVTERLAVAFAPTPAWSTTIVVGPDYAGDTDRLPGDVVRDPADLPARVRDAGLAVIGAGTMKFEVACVGRPMILLAVADDQPAVGAAFAATGAAVYVGDGRTVAPGDVRHAVDLLTADEDARRALARRAAEVVDGRGAERIAGAILGLMAVP